MTLQDPALIIYERHGIWAAQIRQQTAINPIVETRIWNDLLQHMQSRRHSMAILEANESSLEHTTMRAIQLRREFGESRFMVVGDGSLDDCGWFLMELGACFVAIDAGSLRTAVKLIECHLQHAPRPVLSITDSIQQRLPWQAL